MEIMGFAKTVSILGICNGCLFSLDDSKVGCVLQIVVVSTLPHAEFGSIGHREEANHFIYIIRYHGILTIFRSAEDCQGTGFSTRRGFDNCIEHCVSGFNPDNLEWIEE